MQNLLAWLFVREARKSIYTGCDCMVWKQHCMVWKQREPSMTVMMIMTMMSMTTMIMMIIM